MVECLATPLLFGYLLELKKDLSLKTLPAGFHHFKVLFETLPSRECLKSISKDRNPAFPALAYTQCMHEVLW
jgi:hypothetical protein